MCGIAGVIGPEGLPRSVLERMAAALVHRGPDSEGIHQRADVGFAVRRLKVIDLATGDQPIRSTCSGATIVYNGELYNYRELRQELVDRGHHFSTMSDTEVALHFYEEYGVGAFHRLNGIFAFAIDDPRTGSVVVARDHLGVKPLYYAEAKGGVVFASEPKALFASELVVRRVERSAMATYLTYGHATPDRTMYAGIIKLPAGMALTRTAAGISLHRYWDIVERARRWPRDAQLPTDELAALLEDAVARNMLSDVPVGAFLSGGIDAGLGTAVMRRRTGQLHTYAVGFGLPSAETRHALEAARPLGTEHTPVIVTPRDAADAIADVSVIYDEPFADEAPAPTYLMSRRARQDVTVVLTGEGGDELFGGYRRYAAEQAYGAARRLPPALLSIAGRTGLERVPALRRFGQTARALRETDRAARYSVWTETFHAEERTRLLGERADRDPYRVVQRFVPTRDAIRDDVIAMMVFELRTWLVDGYLEKVDKATMATSLEARVPLLDPRIVEFMALAPRHWRISGRDTKVLLRTVASRWVDRAVLRRPKQGFGPPIGLWLRTTLADRVDEMVAPSAALGDFVERGAARAIIDDFRRGAWRERQVWSLLMLSLWAERE